MIFDRFSSRSDAEQCVRDVSNRFNVQADIWDSQDDMQMAFADDLLAGFVSPRLTDLFPGALHPPIVLVDRVDRSSRGLSRGKEMEIARYVETMYRGTFAGT
jgi:hypothetical protein